MNLLLNLLGLRVYLPNHLVNSEEGLGKVAIMALHLFATDLFFKSEKKKKKKRKRKKEKKKKNLHQSGNGVLESLGEGGEGVNIVSLVGIKSALGHTAVWSVLQ